MRQYHESRSMHAAVVVDATHAYASGDELETAISIGASIARRAAPGGRGRLDAAAVTHAVTGRGLDGVLDACCRIAARASRDPGPGGPAGAPACS